MQGDGGLGRLQDVPIAGSVGPLCHSRAIRVQPSGGGRGRPTSAHAAMATVIVPAGVPLPHCCTDIVYLHILDLPVRVGEDEREYV